MIIDEVLEILQSRRANLRCSELTEMLRALGFAVKRTKKGNHRKIKHEGLRDFSGSGFDCGHGKNPKVKPGYPSKMRTMINDHRAELEAYLEQEND